MKVIDYLRQLRESGELNNIISLANTQHSLMKIPPYLLEKIEWYDYYEQEQQQGNRNAWSATMRHFNRCDRNDLSRCKLYFEQEMSTCDWINTTHAPLSNQAKYEIYLRNKRLGVSDF